MRNVFNIYDIELKAKGPIFVGSGKEIAKKEYAVLNNEHKVAVFDQIKLTGLLQAKGLVNEYQEFMLGFSRDDVGTWLRKHGINKNEYLPLTKYQLDYGNAQIDTHSTLGVFESVRDPYGLPYIPGSSLKGLLRTVLLAADIRKNKKSTSILMVIIVRKQRHWKKFFIEL